MSRDTVIENPIINSPFDEPSRHFLCGIVKVQRVPVADDSMSGDQPTYRDIWTRIRDGLPRKGRKTEALSGEQLWRLWAMGFS